MVAVAVAVAVEGTVVWWWLWWWLSRRLPSQHAFGTDTVV